MSGHIRAFVLLLLAIAGAAPALAHEIRPAFLQIRELEPNTYDVLWKTPAQGDMRLALNVVMPENCKIGGEPRATMVDAAVVQRWRATCAGGLVGQPISIEHLDQTLTDTIFRFEPLEGAPKTLRLTPDAPTVTIPAKQPWTEVALTYFKLGVEHILTGFDHLMFVLALLILVGNVKRLIGAVTAFTVAHSLTLAGTTLGLVKVSPAPVEASIALSIMFVAAEIIRSRSGKDSLTAKLPWLASFSFGLLHGFGFAGALREIGIPEDAVGLALLFFNVGVEAGQLLFISAVLTVIFLWKRFAPELSPRFQQWTWRGPVYGIGAVSAFWVVERSLAIVAP
ncbi:MAG TPA: HupE/UreJ family protein [Hyphomonadaceae bacterium]|nr:HupE/UreJ family protein [Hyphomonadaceae bacterium]